jgi:hypothetical protein
MQSSLQLYFETRKKQHLGTTFKIQFLYINVTGSKKFIEDNAH